MPETKDLKISNHGNHDGKHKNQEVLYVLEVL
jgi:hypothetical protein